MAQTAALGPVALVSEGLKLASEVATHYRLGQIGRDVGKVLTEIDALKQITGQVLQASQATMMLSGLNLAVSAVGFATLNGKLNTLNAELKTIAQTVKSIQQILQAQRYGQLSNALRDLRQAVGLPLDDPNRAAILHQARPTLGVLMSGYEHDLERAETLEEASAYEELFTLCALARVNCTAELGMARTAREEMEEAYQTWRKHARRVARDLCVAGRPERFMAGEFAQEVPVSQLAEALDFVYDEAKGLSRVDELRMKRITAPGGGALKRDMEVAIPTLFRLQHRDDVLQGYEAQYRSFEELRTRPSDFEKQIRDALLDDDEVEAEGGFVLVDIGTATTSNERDSPRKVRS